uniref:Extensin family protein n=1 Tax=Rhodopseudomonas palustris (strain BisA53) TaxID=316055 RepID=Q07PV0_RHOP5
MTRGVRLYLVGSIVLVSLAGCGRGLFQSAEREPWRTEAEVACLKSGAIKEGADLVRIDPISGPGVCGAEYPLKVAALGESAAFGFADDLRPPGAVGAGPSRWPVNPPRAAAPSTYQPSYPPGPTSTSGYRPSGGPVPLTPPGVAPAEHDIDLPPEGAPESGLSQRYRGASGPIESAPLDRDGAPSLPQDLSQPRLGPGDGNFTGAVGPVAVKPAATLACPIVSALDKWLAEAVQPAAMRWFGARVVEIKQISAYSCRGMNGNSRAHISEHAFGNALDIAAFTLADGRRITVKNGWKGMPEEQGFLRDVHATACDRFNTVLSPGSNIYHYDHIHVDLMRRNSRRIVCKPIAVPGEEIAARLQGKGFYASHSPAYTSAISQRRPTARPSYTEDEDYGNE